MKRKFRAEYVLKLEYTIDDVQTIPNLKSLKSEILRQFDDIASYQIQRDYFEPYYSYLSNWKTNHSYRSCKIWNFLQFLKFKFIGVKNEKV